MAVPTIDSTQSILGYKAYETFSFLAGGAGTPDILFWQATSLPAGLTLDAPAEKALTTPFGVASTDIITCTAHGFLNGDKVHFQSITGGSGLSTPTSTAGVYYVRDKTDNTFKLAATLTGAAIDFTTDISAGSIRKCGTSLITGSVSTPGIYVFGLTAVNMATGTWPVPTGASAAVYFTLGIEASDGSDAVSGSSDTGIDINIDAVTRDVTMASASSSGALFLLKENDTAILNIRFKKSGVALDPDPTEIYIAFKELETEAAILTGGGVVTTAWTKTGSGAAAVCRLPIVMTSDALASSLSNYENDAGTQFDALCEIEWKQAITAVGGITELVASTKTFKVTIARDLVV